MADLRVDYQLLASIHRTLTGLTWEFQNIEDQARAYDKAYGSSDITAAMGSFAGNWSTHRKTMLGTMQNLDRMVAATAQQFHQKFSRAFADQQRATAIFCACQKSRPAALHQSAGKKLFHPMIMCRQPVKVHRDAGQDCIIGRFHQRQAALPPPAKNKTSHGSATPI